MRPDTAGYAFAQLDAVWSDTVRLTNVSAHDIVYHQAMVVDPSGVIHVVWQSDRIGRQERSPEAHRSASDCAQIAGEIAPALFFAGLLGCLNDAKCKIHIEILLKTGLAC